MNVGEELLRKVDGMEEQLKSILAELDPDFLQTTTECTQMTDQMTDSTAPILSASLPITGSDMTPDASQHPNTLN